MAKRVQVEPGYIVESLQVSQGPFRVLLQLLIVAAVFIELPLPLVYAVPQLVAIDAEQERPNELAVDVVLETPLATVSQ